MNVPLMLSDHDKALAVHDERLDQLEQEVKDTAGTLNKLLWLLITTLLGTCGSLAFQILKK